MPIPAKLRNKMASDGSMLHCIHKSGCSGRVEWEHAWLYACKQIQEEWAIVPVCFHHHRGAGLDKDYNRYCSLQKAIKMFGTLNEIIEKYPKKDWIQELIFLQNKYKNL